MMLLWENGVRQGEFADGLGLSRTFVSDFLHGRCGASEETLVAMRDWLQARIGKAVTFDDILSIRAGNVVAPEPGEVA